MTTQINFFAGLPAYAVNALLVSVLDNGVLSGSGTQVTLTYLDLVLTFTGTGLTTGGARLLTAGQIDTITFSKSGVELFEAGNYSAPVSYTRVQQALTFFDITPSPTQDQILDVSAALFLSEYTQVSGSGDADVLFGGDLYRTDIYGGGGNDTLIGGGASAILAGGSGSDTITGGNSGYDLLIGGAGNDSINGGAGIYDEVSYSGDVMEGAPNRGVVVNLSGNALLGVDIGLPGGPVNVAAHTALDGFGNTDTISGIESISGTDFSDYLVAGSDRGNFWGRGGNDTIIGSQSNDYIEGGAGDDVIYAVDYGPIGWGDYILPGTGNNTIIAEAVYNPDGSRDGHDLSFGDIQSGVTANLVAGFASAINMTVTFSEVHYLVGSGSGDTFIGGVAAFDVFEGYTGNGGNDYIDGGSGWDRIDYNNEVETGYFDASGNEVFGVHGVVVDLAAGTATDAFGDHDTLLNIEAVRGTWFDDVITGSDVRNQLDGGEGNDTVHGGGGDDSLYGWLGDDSLFGEAGSDYLRGSTGTDVLDGGNGFDTIGFGGIDPIAPGEGVHVVFNTAGAMGGGTIGGTITDAWDGDGNPLTRAVNTLFTGIERIEGTNGNDSFVLGGGFVNTIDAEHPFFSDRGDTRGSGGAFNVTGGGGADSFTDASDPTPRGDSGGRMVIDYGAERWTHAGYGGDHAWGVLAGEHGVAVNMSGTSQTATAFSLNDGSPASNLNVAAHTAFDTFGAIDVLSGIQAFYLTQAGDWIWTDGSKDTYAWGWDGNDHLIGGGGDDALFGGNGDDIIFAGEGANVVVGEGGADALHGGSGWDFFAFLAASDSQVGAQRDVIFSWDGSDMLGLADVDADDAQAGLQQFVFIGQGSADLNIGRGQLKYYQQGGNTFVVANTGAGATANFQVEIKGLQTLSADNFYGISLAGLSGTPDDDTFLVTPGTFASPGFSVNGLGGYDTLEFTAPGNVAAANLGAVFSIEAMTFNVGGIGMTIDDTFVSHNNAASVFTVTGSSGNDVFDALAVTVATGGITVVAGSGTDTFLGGAGSDTFRFDARTTGDTVSGGGGASLDTLQFTANGIGLTTGDQSNLSGLERIVFAGGTNSVAPTNALVGSAFNQTLVVVGGAGNDTIYGGNVTTAANRLDITAGAGNDTLNGGAGNDSLTGGGGTNTLTGGADQDSFRFLVRDHAIDTVTDFVAADDTLVFATSAFDVNGASFDSRITAATTAVDITGADLVIWTGGVLNTAADVQAYLAAANGGSAGEGLFIAGTNAGGQAVLFHTTDASGASNDLDFITTLGTLTTADSIQLNDFAFV